MASPGCPCCYDVEFDGRVARRDLAAYRRNGPGRTTRILATALAGDATDGGAEGLTVLDVGGGIGGLHRLLLDAGASVAVDVDASAPYLATARSEAERTGLGARVAFVHGDFVAVEGRDGLAPTDLVGLDRVVCCYPDVDALVGAAARLTTRRLGIAVPPDGVLARIAVGSVNVWQRLIRSELRMHAHPHQAIATAAARFGLVLRRVEPAGIWRVLVFERPETVGAQAGG
jgi:magnesium-protoporphyrin O-methyltransferase